jgi:hypothetical protein
MNHINMRATLIICIATFGLAACVNPNYRYDDPDRDSNDALVRFNHRLSVSQFAEAVAEAEPFLGNASSSSETMRQKIRESPPLMDALAGYLDKRSKISAPKDGPKFVSAINAAVSKKLISEKHATTLRASFDEYVRKGNASGLLPFTVADDLSVSSALRSEDSRRTIFFRSLRLATDSQKNSTLNAELFSWAKEFGSNSTEMTTLRQQLKSLYLTRSDLSTYVLEMFPDDAKELLENRTVRLRLITEPPDRLVYEDVAKRIASAEGITILQNNEQSNSPKNIATVVLRKHQYDFHQEPERTQTVAIPRHEVNLPSALLLMPRDSSYIYELTTGAAELEYAYEISLLVDGREITNTLLRDRVSKSYSFCTNRRVQNVFGGIEGADWTANATMAANCNSIQKPVRASTLREKLIEALGDGVIKTLISSRRLAPSTMSHE